MKCEALENFCGSISMCVGEVQDIPDDIAEGLAQAGYVKPLEEKKAEKEPAKKKGAKS